VDEVLREVLARGVPLCATVNVNGNHWHALAPMDADGRVLARNPAGRGYPTDAVRKALSGEAWEAASAYVQAYAP
jgi:ABC-type Fe3+ transport system substrate-binding protein